MNQFMSCHTINQMKHHTVITVDNDTLILINFRKTDRVIGLHTVGVNSAFANAIHLMN